MSQPPFNYQGQPAPSASGDYYSRPARSQVATTLAEPRPFLVNPPNWSFKNDILTINNRNHPFVFGHSAHLPLKNSIWFSILEILPFLVIALFCGWRLQHATIIFQSNLTQGHVTSRVAYNDSKGEKIYLVTYTFNAPTTNNRNYPFPYSGFQEVDEATYNAHTPNTPSASITIKYDTNDPDNSMVFGQPFPNSGEIFIFLPILIVVVVIIVFILYSTYFNWRLNKLLERKGYIIEGRLENSRVYTLYQIRRLRYRRRVLKVQVVFTNQHGELTHVNYRINYGIYQQGLNLVPGTRVGLVYYDNKHYKLM